MKQRHLTRLLWRLSLICLALAVTLLAVTPPATAGVIDAQITADGPGGNGSDNGLGDAVLIRRSGSTVEVLLDGFLSQTLDYESLATITVLGSSDDDTLTVDFDGGNPVPAGGLFYHGLDNTTAGDTLRLSGGWFGSTSYRFINPTDGFIELDGSVIAFTGLEPVIDLVPGSLTVNATNAVNTVSYVPGVTDPVNNGLVAVDSYETIEFSNKTSLVLNAMLGDDTVILANPGQPLGLTSITVNGGLGDDTIRVPLDSPVALSLNGDDGDDDFNVRPSTTAVIDVQGGSHFFGDTLTVDPQGAAALDTGAAVQVSGFQDVTYAGIEDVFLMGIEPLPDMTDLRIANIGCDPATEDCDLAGDLDIVTAGNLLRYSLPVANVGWAGGGSTATNVVARINLPAESEVVNVVSSDGECVAGTPGDPSDPTTCVIEEMIVGESHTIQVWVRVSPDVPVNPTLPCDQPAPYCRGRIFADAWVTSDVVDPDLSNNLDTESTEVKFEADLQVFLADVPDTVVAGEALTYELIVNNAGPSTSRDAIMLLDLPSNLSFLSATVIDDLNGEEACSLAASDLLICELGDMPPAAPPLGQKNILVNVLVNPAAPAGTITAGASAMSTFSTYDPDPSNNTASAGCDSCSEDTSVATRADLWVGMSSVPAAVSAGQQVGYAVTAGNEGPSDAQNTTVMVTLPPGTAYLVNTGGCVEIVAGQLQCDLGVLSAGETQEFDVFARVDPAAMPGTMLSAASVTGTTSLGDPDAANDITTSETTIEGLADLRILKFGKPDGEVLAGEPLTYTIIVDNLGPGYAHNVVLSEILRSDGTFEVLSITSDRPAVCTSGPGVYDGTLQMECYPFDPLEVMTPLASGRWMVTVEIVAYQAQDIDNVALVYGDDPDPDFANNTATVEHAISDTADLSLAMAVDPVEVREGEDITYTITVDNTGPSAAEGVIVRDSLPAGVVLTGTLVSGGPGECFAGELLVCNLGDIPAAETRMITITAEIMMGLAEAVLHNSAQVTSSVFDADESNNHAAVFTVVGSALLFFDDFSDGTALGDPEWEVLTGNWKVTPRRKFASDEAGNDRAVVDALLVPSLTAASLAARIRLSDMALKRPNGSLVFALQDDANYRYARLVLRNNKGRIIIGQKGDFDGETDGIKATAVFRLNLKKWYDLRADIYPDGWVKVYINSGATPRVSYKFPTAVDGRIGSHAFRAKTLFDDYQVWYETVLP